MTRPWFLLPQKEVSRTHRICSSSPRSKLLLIELFIVSEMSSSKQSSLLSRYFMPLAVSVKMETTDAGLGLSVVVFFCSISGTIVPSCTALMIFLTRLISMPYLARSSPSLCHSTSGISFPYLL